MLRIEAEDEHLRPSSFFIGGPDRKKRERARWATCIISGPVTLLASQGRSYSISGK